MLKRSLWTLAAILVLVWLVKPMLAGEFPRDWTWDDDDQSRQAHDSITGKPMPELSVSDWVNGEVK